MLSVFRFDCSNNNSKTDASNQHLKQQKYINLDKK